MSNLMGLMKQAQEMQKKLTDMQSELSGVFVEGTSGGGLVRVRMTGKGEVKSVTLDTAVMVPSEKEILEDLIVAACSDARAKAEALMQERIQGLTQGMPLPPGFNPFG